MVSSPGFRIAAASGSAPALLAGEPAASLTVRSQRRRRRRPSASVPPSGPVSSSAAVSSSSVPGFSAQRSRVSSGRVPGSSGSGSSSPATDTGTPEAVRARRSSGTWRVAERTRIAIDDHGTPPDRCARRSVSAMTAASWLALSATMTLTAPGAAPGRAARSRWPAWTAWPAVAAGRRWAIRREAAMRTGPLRRLVPSATTGAGRPSAARNRSGNSVMARTSAPRNA